MRSILFFSDQNRVLPLMAAAWARAMADPADRIDAAGPQAEGGSSGLASFLADNGMAMPDPLLPLGRVFFPLYDLVITFSDSAALSFPPLPGNPVLLRWEIAGAGKALPAERGALETTFARVRQLVHDLFHEGYLDALVQTRRDAELILDNLHEGVIAHDLNRRIFFFNRAAERITGFRRDEVLGRDCHSAFPQRFCGPRCTFCEGPARLPETPFQYPLTIQTRDGDAKRVEMSVLPMKGTTGHLFGVVASFRDVTKEVELARRLGEVDQFAGIIGRDPKMQEIYQVITDVADSHVPVLIHGESGTGKELVAAAIHSQGTRADKLFVPVNCGALPDSLLETELFGHVKGAFTGAVRDRKGRFELADGGTLFLDEIGDISPAMQVKLLRVIQDGVFERVGGERPTKVDVRIIAATHKDLRQEVAAGRFREDLYYRLCVVPIELPPLRERRGDIPLLIQHLLSRAAETTDRPLPVMTRQAMELLEQFEWPGNVRELMNCLQYALVRCKEGGIDVQHLPPDLRNGTRHPMEQPAAALRPRRSLELPDVLEALKVTHNNRVKAARHLGVSRATLYRFLSRHDVVS